MSTLELRRAASRVRHRLLGYWHALTIRLEARRGATRPGKWRRWLSYTTVTRIIWLLGALLVVAWCGEAVYNLATGKDTAIDRLGGDTNGLDDLLRFIGPVLTASVAAALFLFWWYSWTKRRYLARARSCPRRLVLTAGPDIDRIVGREEVAQVIAERLRQRETRRPYLLVGGVGAGNTAVLVRLTELLARQRAVPVPVRLRDADRGSALNFELLAKQRFAEEAPRGILARTKNERVWQQLLADDKVVVIADGLEEALLDESAQQSRDNIIRLAIERAHAERLPLVIASRPHSPLESTPAAIVELEPLSEEEALHFVASRVPDTDERRVDWIVETAEVTESPIYLQIARDLHQHGLLERDRPRDDPYRLDTRSRDRGTLRLWLLETWETALCDGLLRDTVAVGPRERRETLEVVCALACVGLLQDKLEVGFAELLDQDIHAGPARRARTRADHLWSARRGFDRYGGHGTVFSAWHRQRIWGALCDRLGDETSRRLREGNRDQCHALLAAFIGNADKLQLVEGFEKKVRFPHSIIQAYFGFRVLNHLGEPEAGRLVEQALQPPGPSRELLISLVLLSRRRAAELTAGGAGVRAELGKEVRERWRQTSARGRTLARRLYAAAQRRTDDPKALDLYAAAVEVESVEADPRFLADIVAAVHARWTRFKGDPRSLQDAKLRLLKQLGAALRQVSDRMDTTPLYWQLFRMGTVEPSYRIRLAAAQEFGSGGNAAFAVIRERVGLTTDPIEEYTTAIHDLKAWKRREYEAWAAQMTRARSARGSARARTPQRVEGLMRRRRALNQRYRERRVTLFREFVMRAWMVPMLLGSVDDAHRDEARERLTRWLRHLDPKYTGGTPDLPLALETALAQGFKYAANRRKRHPDTYPGNRAELIRQAETVLQRSRCWYSQLSLLQALCLWELPDTAGRHEHGRAGSGPDERPDGTRRRGTGIGGASAVQTVERWLSMAGTVNRAPGGSVGSSGSGGSGASGGSGGQGQRRRLHPFVAEAGDLVALALETGEPERFLWIDEKGVTDTIGSRPRGSGGYRKHNLWIPPAAGWSTLDPRAQRLVADVLVMLNLIERDGHPDEVEERLARVERPDVLLPPCISTDRAPLRPGLRAGTSVLPPPGETCLPDCAFQLCPYPPRGCVPRGEIREPFCRQQQALLPGRWRRCLPRGLRRKTPHWVGMRVRELDRFWAEMAQRTRDD
ncbi:ATP-binding protein [Streptomyces sp. JB150]|uniref:ATP-binding protein n=1 Tax=Streptomyces sp. JB150 TaxID=2714844 RepID=UPI001F0D0412|nr:ATP-binding protein [Streptomyces sp. JB150]